MIANLGCLSFFKIEDFEFANIAIIDILNLLKGIGNFCFSADDLPFGLLEK